MGLGAWGYTSVGVLAGRMEGARWEACLSVQAAEGARDQLEIVRVRDCIVIDMHDGLVASMACSKVALRCTELRVRHAAIEVP